MWVTLGNPECRTSTSWHITVIHFDGGQMVANRSSQTTRFLEVAGLNNRVAMGTQNQINFVALHKMQLLQIIHPITFQLSRNYIPILRSCISTLLIHAFIPKYPFGSLLSVLPQFSSFLFAVPMHFRGSWNWAHAVCEARSSRSHPSFAPTVSHCSCWTKWPRSLQSHGDPWGMSFHLIPA